MALSVLLRAVDNISGPVRRIQGRLGAFRSQAQAIGRRVGFERLASSLGRAGGAARELGAAAGRLIRRMATLAAGAAAVGGAIVHTFASSQERTRQWAARLGIARQELQRLQYAGEQYGVQADAMTDALKELSLRTDEYAQTARGPGAEAFRRLRLSQEDLARVSGDTGELFELVMSRLRDVENVAARQRLVDEIFGGQGGEQLAEMASLSARELNALKREADELGVTVGRQGAQGARTYMRAWRRVGGAMEGVRNTIGVALLPVMTDLMNRVTELVVEHRPAIRAWAESFAEQLPQRLGQLRDGFVALWERLQPVVEVGMQLVDQFGAVNTAAAALGVMIGGPLIVPALKLVAALGSVGVAIGQVTTGLIGLAARALPMVLGGLKALAVAAMAHPVIAAVTAIAGGAALLIANWDRVGPWFRGLWASLTGYVAHGWEAIKSILAQDPLDLMIAGFQRAVSWLRDIDWAGAARAGWDALKTVFSWSPVGLLMRGFGRAREWLAGVDWSAAAAAGWEAMKTVFRWSPLGIMQDAFGRTVSWLRDIDWSGHGRRLLDTMVSGIQSAASAPVDAVRGVLGKIRDLLPFSDAKEGPLSALTDSGKALVTTLAEGVQSGRGAFLDTLRGVAAAARDMLGGAWDTVAGFFGGGSSAARAGSDSEVTIPESDMGGGRGSLSGVPAAAGGIVVQRVDFRPQVTIEAREAGTAEELAELIDQRLERWRSRDLWVQIQGVQEAEG